MGTALRELIGLLCGIPTVSVRTGNDVCGFDGREKAKLVTTEFAAVATAATAVAETTTRGGLRSTTFRRESLRDLDAMINCVSRLRRRG
mmetsp:Transcript_19336/g.40474  ORF Transcript_19336/g.40474 Transcript_19336/m.40474 type:complete len:89 (+) Transcript_19336:2521-2787(+)